MEGKKEGRVHGVSEYPEGQKAGQLAGATRVGTVSVEVSTFRYSSAVSGPR